MPLIVTGAAGFIGSNLVRALNDRGEYDIIAVDNLTRGEKFRNLADCTIADYLDKEDFMRLVSSGSFDGEVDAIFHQGACSDTREANGRYMMENNYRYSVELLTFCQAEEVPFLYASSAAVYGAGQVFLEDPRNEIPLNVYGYSKALFDQWVRGHSQENTAQVVGLRYFNVYGPREAHKGSMASVVMHFFKQYQSTGRLRLFEGSGGYGPGEQRRDFVSVADVVKILLHFLDNPLASGIFNVGTGAAASYNEMALAVIGAVRQARGEPALALEEAVAEGHIEYVAFPEGLRQNYQSFTQADLGQLRRAGYAPALRPVARGVAEYVTYLQSSERAA